MDIPAGTLERLLREDGIVLADTGGAEKMVSCFLPGHDDNQASMSVNIVKGVWKCFVCDTGGNEFQYLMVRRGLSRSEARELLNKMAGNSNWTDAKDRQARQWDKQNQDRPLWMQRIPEIEKGNRALADHLYHLADGTLACHVRRYATKKAGDPKCKPYTPCEGGGFWSCEPLHEKLPLPDRRCDKRPLYRLPELLQALEENPETQIYIVEGEKAVDAMYALKAKGDGPFGPITTAMFGKFPPEKTDLSPLQGRKVLLMADQDETGRKLMQKLARVLAGEYECNVRLFMPPGDAQPREPLKGYDVADCVGYDCVNLRGSWQDILAWVQEVGGPHEYKREKRETEAEPAKAPMEETAHFKVLGLYGNEHVAIQSKATHEVHIIKRTLIFQEGPLLTLAPLAWWVNESEGNTFGATMRRAFGDAILRAAEKKGHVDVSNLRGRGAFREGDTYSYNLGDRVLFEGPEGKLTKEVDIGKAEGFFQPGSQIKLKNDDKAPEYALALYKAVMGYRWLASVDGRAFLGWIVTSIIGGALPFRPMIWVLAPASSGKSFLMTDILQPVLSNIFVASNDASPAGLSGVMQNDSLPCCLDEFEPQKGDEHKWSSILHLIRQCTSGDMARLRGSANNALTVSSQPRFSIILSSVHRPRLTTADDSRFFTIRFSAQGVQDWIQVRDNIEAAVSPQKMLALRTYIIRHTKNIVRKAREIEHELLDGNTAIDTREAMIISALTAGAGFLSGDYAQVRRRQGVREDTYAIFNYLLSAPINLGGGEVATLAEILRKGYWDEHGFDPSGVRKEYWNHASRYGFRMKTETMMLIGTNLPVQSRLLKDTEYANVDLEDYFRRLPGVGYYTSQHGAKKKLSFGGIQRITFQVDSNALKGAGFIDEEEAPRYSSDPVPF